MEYLTRRSTILVSRVNSYATSFHVKLLSLFILLLKVRFLVIVKSRLKHYIFTPLIRFFRIDWTLRIFIRISPWSEIGHSFKPKVFLMYTILIFLNFWILCAVFEHSGRLGVRIADLLFVLIHSIVAEDFYGGSVVSLGALSVSNLHSCIILWSISLVDTWSYSTVI